MKIKLTNGTYIFLQYELFKVASAKDKYRLTVERFRRTTTDPIAYHNGMCFTIRDQDNDQWSKNYVQDYDPDGGWWHANCI